MRQAPQAAAARCAWRISSVGAQVAAWPLNARDGMQAHHQLGQLPSLSTVKQNSRPMMRRMLKVRIACCNDDHTAPIVIASTSRRSWARIPL